MKALLLIASFMYPDGYAMHEQVPILVAGGVVIKEDIALPKDHGTPVLCRLLAKETLECLMERGGILEPHNYTVQIPKKT